MSDWFRRKTKNIQTINRKDIKEGSWIKCNECNIMIYKNVLKDNFYVCHECNYHFRIPSNIYLDILIDFKLLEIILFLLIPWNLMFQKIILSKLN